MTKTVDVVTSVERRRRWTRPEKERIVAPLEWKAEISVNRPGLIGGSNS